MNVSTLFTFEVTFWEFYAALCVLAAANIGLLAYAWIKTTATDSYSRWMRILAVPYVWECIWRSVFPSLYLQRYVVWDTALNSIFVDRGWACIGELTWTFQIALAMRHIDKELNKGGTTWVQLSGWLAFFIYVVAEGLSYYNVSTTNEWWCAAEVVTDGISFAVMFPGLMYLTYKQWHMQWTTGKVFALVGAIACVLYPLYNFTVDAPMYLKRYAADQAAHKKYFPFWEGLKDSAVTRHVTHQTMDWNADFFWMVAYFSIGAWSSILLMWAPRAHPDTTTKEKEVSLVVASPSPSYALLAENQV